MKITFPLLFLFVARSALSIRITSNGLKRAYRGRSCSFKWKIDQLIVNYTISNQTTGSPTALRRYSHHYYDSTIGEITLTINYIQLWDAGNYSLHITQALTTANDSTACLFVYGELMGSLMLSSGRDPATEGDTLEFTCNLTSTSLPAAYRPNNIYTSWRILGDYWTPETTNFSGPILDRDGNVIPGYMTKNNGRTLNISSVQHYDQRIECHGREDGQTSEVHRDHNVDIRYKPYIKPTSPRSKKFNVAYGEKVELRISWECNPTNISSRSWEFVNESGVSQNLPPDSDFREDYSNVGSGHTWLRFNFTSDEYYGNYSFNVTNDLGSATITFQVLPEGPPDAPTNVKIKNVTHNTIDIQWNVMWSNSFDLWQTVYRRLTHVENGTIVKVSSTRLDSDKYNESYSRSFSKNIQPMTDYSVKVWSENEFGSSEVIELQVRTPEQPKLIVTTVSTESTEESVTFTTQGKQEDVNSIDREDRNSLLFAVIALTLLMGMIPLACLTAYLLRRFRTNRQQLSAAHYQGIIKDHVNEESPQSHEDNVYEELEDDDHQYARILSTRNETDDYETPI